MLSRPLRQSHCSLLRDKTEPPPLRQSLSRGAAPNAALGIPAGPQESAPAAPELCAAHRGLGWASVVSLLKGTFIRKS